MKPIYTYDEMKRKEVRAGCLIRDSFIKTVIPARHFHRMTKSYAIQTDVLISLSGLNCKFIIIQEENGRRLKSFFAQWFADDIREIDFGNGKQRFLPVERMEILDGQKD